MLFRWVFLVTLFAVSGCATLPKIVEPSKQLSNKHLPVYVISHGRHTGIVIPAHKVTQAIPALVSRFEQEAYLEFGWGDAGFYQADKVTSGLTLRALFFPSGSVVHVVGFSESPLEYFEGSIIEEVNIDEANMGSLVQFIRNSLVVDDEEALLPIKKGLYGNSQFYAGIGNYYILNTCNKWTAKALYSGGVDISPRLKLTSGSVMGALK